MRVSPYNNGSQRPALRALCEHDRDWYVSRASGWSQQCFSLRRCIALALRRCIWGFCERSFYATLVQSLLHSVQMMLYLLVSTVHLIMISTILILLSAYPLCSVNCLSRFLFWCLSLGFQPEFGHESSLFGLCAHCSRRYSPTLFLRVLSNVHQLTRGTCLRRRDTGAFL